MDVDGYFYGDIRDNSSSYVKDTSNLTAIFILYVNLGVFGFITNLILLVVLCRKRKAISTDVIFCFVSVSAILFTVGSVPYYLNYYFHLRRMSLAICRVHISLSAFHQSIIVLSLTVIAIERFYCITTLNFGMNFATSIKICLIIIFVGLAISTSFAAFIEMKYYDVPHCQILSPYKYIGFFSSVVLTLIVSSTLYVYVVILFFRRHPLHQVTRDIVAEWKHDVMMASVTLVCYCAMLPNIILFNLNALELVGIPNTVVQTTNVLNYSTVCLVPFTFFLTYCRPRSHLCSILTLDTERNTTIWYTTESMRSISDDDTLSQISCSL
ncbi:Uncharacterised protein g11323 [Pycnogonum litorale]